MPSLVVAVNPVDELRWILLTAGVVLVVAIYVFGRTGRENWKRPRPGLLADTPRKQDAAQQDNVATHHLRPVARPRREPHFKTADPKFVTGDEPTVSVSEASVESVEKETVDIDTPEDLAAEEKAIKSVRSPLNISPEPEPEPKATIVDSPRLDIEPLVLAFTVMARDDELFAGENIRRVLEAEGLSHGDMQIFHYHVDAAVDAVFSVASVLEPGTFDLETLAAFHTTGLSLFCQLPGPLSPANTYAAMLDKAGAVADALGGELCDDRRNRLSAQEEAHYKERVAEFSRKLVLASRRAARGIPG